MKILAIIPARYNSTRFPGKPLVEINGKSMIRLVYEQAQKVKSFNKIIVATDDERIYNHVIDFGGEVTMTSFEHKSGTDRCGEVINKLNKNYDVVVNIQGDEPFIQPEQLELLVSAFNNSSIQIATLAKKITDEKEINNPNVVKVVFDKNKIALNFSRNIIEKNNCFKHIGIYAYRSVTLKQIIQLPQTEREKAEKLEQLRWLENNFVIKIVETEIDTVGIDSPEDLRNIK